MMKSDIETATARSEIYGLLATMFRKEPDRQLLEKLREPQSVEMLADLGVSFGADFHDTAIDQLIEDLGIEYTRLFIGPGSHLSPHESVHAVSGSVRDGELWGQQTVKVKAFIEASGLTYAEDFDALPDHIAAELEFMARLTAHEAQCWRAGDEENARGCLGIERRFFKEHLNQWIPGFCGKIVQRNDSEFYSRVAELTRGVLDFDYGIINASLPPEPEIKVELRLKRRR